MGVYAAPDVDTATVVSKDGANGMQCVFVGVHGHDRIVWDFPFARSAGAEKVDRIVMYASPLHVRVTVYQII